MSKYFLITTLVSLFALQSHATLKCVADQGGLIMTPIGLVVTSTTYELKDRDTQVGSDFETKKSCLDIIRKMGTDRPFACLPLQNGFAGAVSKFIFGATYAVFGPNGKQYGMEFGAEGKRNCEEIAIQGTIKGVCTAMSTDLKYVVTVDGKEEQRTKKVFNGYELWGSGDKKRYTNLKACLAKGKKLLEETAPALAPVAKKSTGAVR